MKSTLFTFIMAFVWPLVGEAQTQKGHWTVGAQIGSVSYQKQNESRTIVFNITPSAGYFVADGLVIGTGIPISASSQKTTNSDIFYGYKYTSSAIGLSPFVRYFLGKKKLKPYLGVAYSYSQTSSKRMRREPTGTFESEGKGKITAFVPTVGVAYFISQNLGLTVGLNYNINHQDQESTTYTPGYPSGTTSYDSDTKLFSLTAGFQLFIGK